MEIQQEVQKGAAAAAQHPCIWVLEQIEKPHDAFRNELLNVYAKYIPEFSASDAASDVEKTSLESFLLTRTVLSSEGPICF